MTDSSALDMANITAPHCSPVLVDHGHLRRGILMGTARCLLSRNHTVALADESKQANSRQTPKC